MHPRYPGAIKSHWQGRREEAHINELLGEQVNQEAQRHDQPDPQSKIHELHRVTLSVCLTKNSSYHVQWTSISGTALSGRKPISGETPVRSDSFHRQNVQRLAGISCERDPFCRVSFRVFSSSRLSEVDCVICMLLRTSICIICVQQEGLVSFKSDLVNMVSIPSKVEGRRCPL
jgi:hypothetical protein